MRKRQLATSAAAAISVFIASCGDSRTTTLQIPGSLKNGPFTGHAITTRYGDVQVQIIVSNGHIADVQAPLLPSDRSRSVEINNSAGPILHNEVLRAASAQTAQIDTVSGATYTSDAYVQSLQSALDQAHR